MAYQNPRSGQQRRLGGGVLKPDLDRRHASPWIDPERSSLVKHRYANHTGWPDYPLGQDRERSGAAADVHDRLVLTLVLPARRAAQL